MHLTAEVVELVDVRDSEPENGARVLALTQGGKLVEAVWNSRSRFEYDAWSHYPRIPTEVKQRQIERYK
jgi:hypothetical protein